MKITEGWMNHKGGNFSADMSDIEGHAKDTSKDIHCPGCKKTLHMNDFKVSRDDDNDITNWKHNCKSCGAKLIIFNELLSPVKPTFKQFIAEAASKNKYQVRIETPGMATGDWKDVSLYADSIQDIADAVGASPMDADKHAKFDVSQLTEFVEDWIGVGPDGPGTSWDEYDMDVKSMGDDVLKISWSAMGVNMRQKQGKYGTEVKKHGILTIMPGS